MAIRSTHFVWQSGHGAQIMMKELENQGSDCHRYGMSCSRQVGADMYGQQQVGTQVIGAHCLGEEEWNTHHRY